MDREMRKKKDKSLSPVQVSERVKGMQSEKAWDWIIEQGYVPRILSKEGMKYHYQVVDTDYSLERINLIITDDIVVHGAIG